MRVAWLCVQCSNERALIHSHWRRMVWIYGDTIITILRPIPRDGFDIVAGGTDEFMCVCSVCCDFFKQILLEEQICDPSQKEMNYFANGIRGEYLYFCRIIFHYYNFKRIRVRIRIAPLPLC